MSNFKLSKDVVNILNKEIQSFCKSLEQKLISTISQSVHVEKKDSMTWLAFWHELEAKISNEFDMDLSEIEQESFDVLEYWNLCKDSPIHEQKEKIAEALNDLQGYIDYYGKEELIVKDCDED